MNCIKKFLILTLITHTNFSLPSTEKLSTQGLWEQQKEDRAQERKRCTTEDFLKQQHLIAGATQVKSKQASKRHQQIKVSKCPAIPSLNQNEKHTKEENLFLANYLLMQSVAKKMERTLPSPYCGESDKKKINPQPVAQKYTDTLKKVLHALPKEPLSKKDLLYALYAAHQLAKPSAVKRVEEILEDRGFFTRNPRKHWEGNFYFCLRGVTHPITTLPPRVYASFLTMLNLRENNLAGIPNGCFKECSALKILVLIKNKLTELRPSMFEGLAGLEILRLPDNQVSHIAPNTFAQMPNLTEVDLAGNQLQALPVSTFAGVKRIGWLDLRYNPMIDALTTPEQYRAKLKRVVSQVLLCPEDGDNGCCIS